MVAILYCATFVLLWFKYRKKYPGSVGAWLLLWYAISSILTLWENFTIPINSDHLNPIACIYYVACQLLALAPFLCLGKYDCRDFRYSSVLFTYLAYVLIVFGVYDLVISSHKLLSNLSILFGDISQLRNSFYDTFLETKSATPFEKLNIIVKHIQYMSPFLAFFFLCKGKNKLAVMLFLASLSMPIGQMTKGEREGVLTYLANLYFCYIFFKPSLNVFVRKKVKKIGWLVLTPLMLFIVAMTLSRFGGDTNGGLLHGLFLYGGDQPFLFTAFFNDSELLSQSQWGRVNFQYFFPPHERVQGQINLVIDSDIYLNQFAGMPGSFFLDFGYYTILIVAIFSLLYYSIIKTSRKIDNRYPLHVLFLFYFSFQVLYMNIFYFDFHSLFYILFSVVFFVACCVYTGRTTPLHSAQN